MEDGRIWGLWDGDNCKDRDGDVGMGRWGMLGWGHWGHWDGDNYKDRDGDVGMEALWSLGWGHPWEWGHWERNEDFGARMGTVELGVGWEWRGGAGPPTGSLGTPRVGMGDVGEVASKLAQGGGTGGDNRRGWVLVVP